jgi:hypothetical protein
MITHKVFENMSNLKHARRAATNQNYPHEYIERNLNTGKTYSVTYLLSSESYYECLTSDHPVIKAGLNWTKLAQNRVQ